MNTAARKATAPRGYKPREGSIAARAIEYLAAHGETNGAALAQMLDFEPATTLQACITAAIDAGLITKRKKDGINWYSAPGAGVKTEPEPDPAPADDADVDTAPMIQRIVPANGTRAPATQAARSVFDLGTAAAKRAADKPAAAPAADATTVRVALWSDGTLEIRRCRAERTVELCMLDAAETRGLVHYLERMACGDGAPA